VGEVRLAVEVAGCPTVCRHCWAQGTPYGEMPLEDAAYVLDAAAEACAGEGLALAAYPMHEVAAHSRAPEVLRLFADRVGAHELEPLSTTGVPLAVRDDWRELLETARELGTTTVWLALHGAPADHDRVVNRPGAYQETKVAAARIHAAGLRVGCNVFVTKANLERFDELAGAVDGLDLDEESWEPAAFYPTRRGRRYGVLQPGLDDLGPVAERVHSRTSLWREHWTRLSDFAEASWMRKALDGGWPSTNGAPAARLVCRPNLDLHAGNAGLYGAKHGNLRRDGARAVLQSALAAEPTGDAELFFGPARPPAAHELAERHGNPEGREVHFAAASMRNRWLERWSEAG
jgi:hypothetical protein